MKDSPSSSLNNKSNSTKSVISQSSTVHGSTSDPYSELGDSSANGVVSDGNGNYQEEHNPAATPLNGMLTSNAKIKRNKLVDYKQQHHHPSQKSLIAASKIIIGKVKSKQKNNVRRNKIRQKKKKLSKRKISKRKVR